jgi:hypothetical protein
VYQSSHGLKFSGFKSGPARAQAPQYEDQVLACMPQRACLLPSACACLRAVSLKQAWTGPSALLLRQQREQGAEQIFKKPSLKMLRMRLALMRYEPGDVPSFFPSPPQSLTHSLPHTHPAFTHLQHKIARDAFTAAISLIVIVPCVSPAHQQSSGEVESEESDDDCEPPRKCVKRGGHAKTRSSPKVSTR